MTTAELTGPQRAPSPTVGEILGETVPLIVVVPSAGPPIVVLAGPWLLFALMLAGPFALLVTAAVLLVAALAVVGLIAAILAAPCWLVRRLQEHETGHAPTSAATAQHAPVTSRRAAA